MSETPSFASPGPIRPPEASSEPIVELLPARTISILGIKRAIHQRRLNNETAQLEAMADVTDPISDAGETGGDAGFYRTMAEDILKKGGYTRDENGQYRTDEHGNYVREPSPGYDPGQRFGKAHRTKRAEFGEPVKVPPTDKEARTIAQYGASRRRNLWLNKINKQQDIQHEMHMLLAQAGEHIHSKEELEEVLDAGRFPYIRKHALRRALKTSLSAQKKEQKYIGKLVKTANGEDFFGNFNSVDTIDSEENQEKEQKLRENIDDRQEKLDKINGKIETKRYHRTENKLKSSVKRKTRATFAGEVVKAWQGRTVAALEHREQFYDDLGRATEASIEDPDARMTVNTYHKEEPRDADGLPLKGTAKKKERRARFTEGGAIEHAAVVRNSRHKAVLESLKERGKSGRPVERRKEIMERRAAKYRAHDSTTRRRQSNREKLVNRRTKVTEQHRELHAAKQRLRTLREHRP